MGHINVEIQSAVLRVKNMHLSFSSVTELQRLNTILNLILWTDIQIHTKLRTRNKGKRML